MLCCVALLLSDSLSWENCHWHALCVPQDLSSQGGEEEEEVALGDVVEEELAATSQAVEEAARRIQV